MRAVVQLTRGGYVLVYLLCHSTERHLVLLGAFRHAIRRHGNSNRSHQAGSLAIAGDQWHCTFLGAGLTPAYVDTVVIAVHPWYDPRYLVPLFGMIVSNAMNSAALAAERLASEINARRAEIEAYLALGRRPHPGRRSRPFVERSRQHSFQSSIV